MHTYPYSGIKSTVRVFFIAINLKGEYTMEERSGSSNIIIENRRKINATGVIDVISFDEDGVTLDTELGSMIIKGADFKINKLNTENGEFVIEGLVSSIIYSDSLSKNNGGFFAKLFK